MGGPAALAHQLGGDVASARTVGRLYLVDHIHDSLATEVILGHRRRARWRRATR